MVKTTRKKRSVKASADKTSGKPPPRDKTLVLEPAIHFYKLEDGGETAEGEESEIPVVCDSSLTVSKQNLVKRKSPYIDMFDHEGPAVVKTMHELNILVLDHLDINFTMDMDQRVAYMQRIIRGYELKAVLVECKQLVKDLAGDK